MSGLFSLGAEPVYPGNEFSFSSSYSRGKQLMSSCVLQQLLANKPFLYSFFPVHLHRDLRWHKSFLSGDLAGCLLQVAWCWLWFHDSLILCCCTSLEILSVVLPVRFFFILDELQSHETAFTNPPLIIFYQWKLYCCLEYCVQGAQQFRTRQGVKAFLP